MDKTAQICRNRSLYIWKWFLSTAAVFWEFEMQSRCQTWSIKILNWSPNKLSHLLICISWLMNCHLPTLYKYHIYTDNKAMDQYQKPSDPDINSIITDNCCFCSLPTSNMWLELLAVYHQSLDPRISRNYDLVKWQNCKMQEVFWVFQPTHAWSGIVFKCYFFKVQILTIGHKWQFSVWICRGMTECIGK